MNIQQLEEISKQLRDLLQKVEEIQANNNNNNNNNNNVNNNNNNKVILDIGGKRFVTLKSTLTSQPDSYFSALFNSGNFKPEADGAYFIDRNPKYFSIILEFLRTGILSVSHLSPEQLQAFNIELDYYQIKTEDEPESENPLSKPEFQCIASNVSTLAHSAEIRLCKLEGLTFNPLDECLYVCDLTNSLIRRITREGNVYFFATINRPYSIVFSEKGNCFYVSKLATHSIEMLNPDGTFKGTLAGYDCGFKNGSRTDAQFYNPYGLTVDQETGNVYVADYSNFLIRKITPAGDVTTFAGIKGKKGITDGDEHNATFQSPYGICFSQLYKCLFVCDYGAGKLRKVSLDGSVSTVCAIPFPWYPCMLPDGSILVSSERNHLVYKVTVKDFEKNVYESSVFAGGEESSRKSVFQDPRGITVDSKSNTCFVADRGAIRSIKYDKI